MIDLVAWAERFIATPSVSRDGNGAMAELACALLREAGLEPRLLPARHEGMDHFCVVADVGPTGEGGLLLVTHLDTVPPGPSEAWTATGGDPFRPTRDGDRLYGLGSADAKVDLVCKAAALEGLDPAQLRRPLRIVGTWGEEIGMLGARALVEAGGARGMRCALIGEPSELAAVRAHKGYAVYRARVELEPLPSERAGRSVEWVFEGESAHSSTPHLGRNAIEAALERLAQSDVVGIAGLSGGAAVNQVPDRCTLRALIEGDGPAGAPRAGFRSAPLVAFLRAWRDVLAALRAPLDPDFDPAHTVGNLGRASLEGGAVELMFDLRPVGGADVAGALAKLGRTAKIECVRTNPALATPENAPLVACVRAAQQAAGVAPRVATKATSTEAGIFAEAGLEALVLGPGLSVGNVHKPNEHTSVSQLAKARALYRELVRRVCVEGAPCSS